jgi:CRISPR-associated protein Csx10
MNMTLTFKLELKSDFHVGAGHRRGTEIDSALLREHDGRPALRGSLLGQMLRDSARELFATPAMTKREYTLCKSSRLMKESEIGDEKDSTPEYCGQWHEHETVCPICHVFGTPRTPRRWQFSSAWLQKQQAGESMQISDRDWGAQPVMRVRVSPATRRAEANKLFSEEIGDGRLVFCFEATWQGNGEPDEKEIALLAAAAANLRHFGKSRRRGRGLCCVQLIGVDHPPLAKDWLELFKQELVDKKWQPEPHKPKIETPILSAELATPAWQPVRVRIVAHLDEPVLVARRASAGNQFEGVNALPGNILLGALAARAARHVDLREAGAYQNFVGLFRRGYARFSFLSLAHAEDTILYPSFAPPLDVFRCKQQPPHFDKREYHRAFALLENEEIRCDLCPKDDDAVDKLEKLQTLRGGDFGSDVELAVDKREEMHVQINPETQRAQDGKLFEYVCLQAGQYLCGEIICRNQKVWDDLRSIAALQESKDKPIPLRLGKATRRGYGRVSAVFFVEKDDKGLYQKTLRERLPSPKGPFTLLLATDTIIRDKWGRFPTSFEEGWLADALGMEHGDIKLIRGFAKTREIDGFHNYLGLPRWRDRAFIAGSAAGIQIITDKLSNKEIWEKLERLELEGIGLRRHEGFGQIVVNHPVYEAIKTPGSGGSVSIEWNVKKRVEVTGSEIESERKFRQEWEGMLAQFGDKHLKGEQRWGQFEFKEFAPVARLLRSGCDLPIYKSEDEPKALYDELKALSDFDFDTENSKYRKRKLDYEVKLGSNQTLAPRESKKFFEKEDKGKPGMELINEIFKALQKKTPSNAKLRAIGVEMLALIIAEAANRAIKEGRK